MTDSAASQPGIAPGDRVVIGISFGNTNSSIAHTVDSKAEVIANEDGDRQIPTILSYVAGDEYTGVQAKNFLVRNPQNTVAFFRDFLGKDFKSIDPTHCHGSAHPHEANGSVAFTIKEHRDKEPEGDEEDAEPQEAPPSTLSVNEIATRYFRRLVQSASSYIGKTVTSAVITVPTNFTEKQRETLIKVVNDAGVEVLQLISEPVAAVLAYDARSGSEVKDKIIVVADLGGTRSDVAVVASRGGMYTILATAHDYEFAGVHLDQVLMDHFAKEFLKKHPKASDPRQNARSLAKLRLEAEATKKALSLGTNASFSVESLVDGIDFAATINRTRYETIARKVLEGVDRLVLGVIKKAGLDVLDIDEVILSGGTSHTPRIATNLRERVFTPATEIQAPSTSPNAINPSELQARGAALQASLIQEYDAEDIEQSTHPAVTTVPHVANAIGAVVIGSAVGDAEEKVFVPIIAAETAVPARRTIRLATPSQGGDALVQIVEGGTHIKVTKPEPKEKTNGTKDDEDDEDDDDFDDDEEEEEEKREKVWKIGKTLAEAVLRGTKKGGEIEITVNVGADNSLTIAVREVGAKGGVRGTVKAP